MKVQFYVFGKLKTQGLPEAAAYYQKALASQTPVEIFELKSMSVTEKSEAVRAKNQSLEETLLFDKIEANSTARRWVIFLDERGKNLRTLEWAKLIQEKNESSVSHLCFCIGSSLGFSDSARKKANQLLSLGAQTLNHELIRVVLYEQVFRAFAVNSGHPYHNEG